MQGEIRDKFEQEKIKFDDFLKPYYPAPIKPDAYMERVQRKLNKIYDYLEEKFTLDLLVEQLGRFQIINEDVAQAESLTFVGSVFKNLKKVEGYSAIGSDLDNVVEKIETIMESPWLDADDQKQLEYIIEQLDSMSMRYGQKQKKAEKENKKIALFQATLSKFKQQYQSSVSDSQKKLSTYNESMDSAADAIVDIILRRRKNQTPDFKIEKENIGILTERVYDYEFNSRLGITEIDEAYISRLFSSLMKKGAKKTILEMTQNELADAFSGYTDAPTEVLASLKRKIEEQLEEDFASKFTITQAGTDRTQELSSGFNSKIYFDILSYETRHAGTYIIDQPEDNISQKSIREYLLDRFKVMGEKRQVIIVTHNPQFIVNLDVDNVIFIGRDEEKMIVQSGALEYKDENYNILDIISNHIEGGLETLRRRWKRYEKNTSI